MSFALRFMGSQFYQSFFSSQKIVIQSYRAAHVNICRNARMTKTGSNVDEFITNYCNNLFKKITLNFFCCKWVGWDDFFWKGAVRSFIGLLSFFITSCGILMHFADRYQVTISHNPFCSHPLSLHINYLYVFPKRGLFCISNERLPIRILVAYAALSTLPCFLFKMRRRIRDRLGFLVLG